MHLVYESARHKNSPAEVGPERLLGVALVYESAPHKNGMHPTADTAALMYIKGSNGWDDYLLLFHFDRDEPRAEIEEL